MRGFTTDLFRFRIKQRWIKEGLSEILSTFILALSVYASGAQFTLTHGAAGSATGKAMAGAFGLTLAIYYGWRSSGAIVNPNLALLFCLVGKKQWKRYPLYAACEILGAFLAACVCFFIYKDLLDVYDGGVRAVHGDNATAPLFASFPHPAITTSTAFFDIVMATSLLLSSILAITDQNNAATATGLIPIAFGFMLFVVINTFGAQTGAAINPALDLGGRFLLVAAGYGSEVFSHDSYYFWVPIIAGATASVVSSLVYPFMIGNHLPCEHDDEITEVSLSVIENSGQTDGSVKDYKSQNSISTISTFVDT